MKIETNKAMEQATGNNTNTICQLSVKEEKKPTKPMLIVLLVQG